MLSFLPQWNSQDAKYEFCLGMLFLKIGCDSMQHMVHIYVLTILLTIFTAWGGAAVKLKKLEC